MVESRYSNRSIEQNLGRLAPTVLPFVKELFTSGLFTEQDLERIELVSPHSGLPSPDMSIDGDFCDRFKLVLPYAGFSVVWEVIFDGTNPSAPPDFIFDDESFLCDCEFDAIPSLSEWDANNQKSLVNVISDLLKLYSRHQYEGVERCVGPTIGNWLDPQNVENEGLKVEILNSSQKTSPYSTLSRQASSSLPLGSTSVLVVVPVTSDLLDTKNLQFAVHYIFKSHTPMFEEKIMYCPELEGWMQPYSDSFKKRNRWMIDSKGLSAAVQSHFKDITEMFNKSVQEYKDRERFLLKLHHHIMSKEDLAPSVLEFDLSEFQFSSYILQQKRIFAVDVVRHNPRGRLYAVLPDGYHKQLAELNVERLLSPHFDIAMLLARFD